MFDGHTFCHPSSFGNVNVFCGQLILTGSDTITKNPDNSYDFAFFKHVSFYNIYHTLFYYIYFSLKYRKETNLMVNTL